MREALAVLLGLLQLATWAMLGAVTVQVLRTGFWTLRAGRIRPSPMPVLRPDAPFVTVQLPLRNERGRAEDLLRTICSLDWPKERLEVQVLDDSDDDTVGIIDRTAGALRAAGNDVQVVRRASPKGFKAGALAEALRTARGDYIAIFDADARPRRDCLVRLVDGLERDPRLAYVQARWTFENEPSSFLHRTQAVILHALFVGEQARLSALGRPVQFNGTGGLWRRSALESAGGWLDATGSEPSVTEDLALSFRLGLAESFGATLPQISVATELPDSVAAFRQQQARWVRGGGEVFRALVLSIARSGIGRGARATMLGHLFRHARQPLLFALLLTWPLRLWATPRFQVGWAWTSTLSATTLSLGFYFAAARRRVGGPALPAFLLAPAVMSLSMGLCPVLSASFLGGALGPTGKFERTPKGGAYAAPRRGFFELGLGTVYSLLAIAALARGAVLEGLCLAWLCAFGLLWVGTAALGR